LSLNIEARSILRRMLKRRNQL